MDGHLDGGLAVSAYGPNTVTATVGDGTKLTVTQTTNYPYEDTVTLTLSADKTDTYPLYIRVPEWCESPSVTVNGHAVETELVAGEYAALTATWEDGDVIVLTFPAEITATLTEGTHTLRIEKTASDIGFAELDAFDRIPCELTGGVPEQADGE